ncbi:Bro-N domain-containing protein [Serratia liquefaciens]|uniref:BRO-N domain-containing protein n=1 Tax=Serratia liquefaciens TaxID=614 RepID=UPI0022B972DA|nr:BRO family protein [Serratia liquefaciens]
MKLKSTAILGRAPAHPEFTAGANVAELKFHEQVVIPFDNGDGKIWFTMETLADLLGYANAGKVSNIYNRHKDEFTDSMTMVTKVRMNGINNSLREVDVRLFSPRGAHLIGMLSRTKIAKELRIWLLDLAEQESSAPQGGVHHTIEQMRNIVATARKASDDDSSDAGRRLRKRQDDLPELLKAERLVDAMGQIAFDLIGGGKKEVLP